MQITYLCFCIGHEEKFLSDGKNQKRCAIPAIKKLNHSFEKGIMRQVQKAKKLLHQYSLLFLIESHSLNRSMPREVRVACRWVTFSWRGVQWVWAHRAAAMPTAWPMAMQMDMTR